MRKAEIIRKTSETDIALKINLDGKGQSKVQTGCGFLDHMLTLFAKHGSFDLEVKCVGDKEVDFHHTTEDIAICLGQALNKALGDKKRDDSRKNEAESHAENRIALKRKRSQGYHRCRRARKRTNPC